ncbi:methyltransferase family protein [Labedaea rhizosphaerae]|uniref:Protein-S-isoprenylcysteine O-methyltransferase Ste14 n=1 Tax=Labedaea rhizosphaerae TaxID=598644 RepID=A0A4R6SE38_LABRH|nr:isoprenylcysteine carboxylmethyltransferase family protein [Labedaea rhizosphaerae]TDP97964.1 protein-S-isoprenylcysteine O-methyltransferase Ste14 [Labedaea rhizosphaerae]
MPADTKTQRGARVVLIPPPLYYVAGIAAGMAVNALVAFPVGGRPVTVAVGAVIAALGLALAFTGVAAVIRHRTTIVPHHQVAVLLTEGVYRLSRNPMYTGLATAYVGMALVFGSWWPLVLFPLVVLVVRALVIRPEEEYLAQRFGRDYADYAARVRRWL